MEYQDLILSLDRCEHGRHEGEMCFDCPNQVSVGNEIIPAGTVIGHWVRGVPIVVPEKNKRYSAKAWLEP